MVRDLISHTPKLCTFNNTMADTRVAVVTGSNKGIGLAIVRGLCAQFKGDVYLTSRDEQRGKEAVTKLEAEGLSPKYHQLNITDTESVERLKEFILEKYGGLDVLINNAGIAYEHASTVPAVEQATDTVKTNFTGTLNMIRAFAMAMKPHGRIVNVSSYHPGLLSRLTSQDLRDHFSNPDVTEPEVISLMEQFIEDVREGKHAERGWCKTFYSSSKVGETAIAMIYARELKKSGEWRVSDLDLMCGGK